MRNILLAVVALSVVGGGAFMFLGAASKLSDEEIATVLAARADAINATEGERFDDFSRLVWAKAVEKQITIKGEVSMNADSLTDDYLDTRRMQAGAKLCNDEEMRAVMDAGATHVFNWWTQDGESVGMVTLRGAQICEEMGF